MKKKVVSLLLVAAMAASMGCGSNNGGTSNAGTSNAGTNSGADAATTESNEGGADASAADTASDVEKPEEISIMVDGTVFTKENAQDQFIAKLEDAYYDVVGQTIASGEWPDVMILSSTYYAGYAEQGVLWDMTAAYENSELKQRQDAFGSTGVIDGVKIDGKLYGMPSARGNGCVTYVKKAWLDNCGLEAPTNYEEYLAMLEAFTTGDPDGDGTNGNTYGVSAEDAMKAALQRMADAYAKGVIDPTTLTNGTKDCRDKYYGDEFGVFTYWAGTWQTNLETNLEANGKDSELVALAPITEVGQYLDRVPPVWAITSQCENPEGVFKYFIEAMQDGGDVQFLFTYGVEDVHWSTKAETIFEGEENEKVYADGEFHGCENLETPGTQYTKAHIDPMLALVELANDPKDESLPESTKNSAALFNESCVAADLVPTTDAMSEYNGDLTTLKNELVANVVMGKSTIEEAYARYESEHGAEWSQAIVDSLNQ